MKTNYQLYRAFNHVWFFFRSSPEKKLGYLRLLWSLAVCRYEKSCRTFSTQRIVGEVLPTDGQFRTDRSVGRSFTRLWRTVTVTLKKVPCGSHSHSISITISGLPVVLIVAVIFRWRLIMVAFDDLSQLHRPWLWHVGVQSHGQQLLVKQEPSQFRLEGKVLLVVVGEVLLHLVDVHCFFPVF